MSDDSEKSLGGRKSGTFDYKMDFAKSDQSWRRDPGNGSKSYSQRGGSTSNKIQMGMLSLPPPVVARGGADYSNNNPPMASTTTTTTTLTIPPKQRRSVAYKSLIDRLKDRLKEETIITVNSVGNNHTIATDIFYDEEEVPFDEDVPFDEQQSSSGRSSHHHHHHHHYQSLLARSGRSLHSHRVVVADDPPGYVVDVVEDDDDDGYDDENVCAGTTSSSSTSSRSLFSGGSSNNNQHSIDGCRGETISLASRQKRKKKSHQVSRLIATDEDEQEESIGSSPHTTTTRKLSSSGSTYRCQSRTRGKSVHSSSSSSSSLAPGFGEFSIPLTVNVEKSKSSVEKESSASGVSVSSTVPVDDSFNGDTWSASREKEHYHEQQPQNTAVTATSARKNSIVRGSCVTEDGLDDLLYHELHFNFLDDDPKTMTNSRILALYLMKRFAWYNPRLNSTRSYQPDVVKDGGRFRSDDGYPRSHRIKETPSLEKAWAYFEHVTLTRHYTIESEEENAREKKSTLKWIKDGLTFDHQLDRAEPGEAKMPTSLYHPFLTPFSQLGDFGLGIGLYFATIRGLTLLVVIAGIIHIPNIIYFAGSEYSKGQTDVATLRRGSAICTDSSWVVCPTCTRADFPAENEGYSFLYSAEHNIFLARKNFCEGATLEQGFVNLGCFLFICVGSIFLAMYLKGMEKSFDEDEQTTRDYSIRIDNPPGDARDPLEWKEYFREQFGAHVTGCTISLSNDELVRALKERREKMRKLEADVKSGTSLDMVTLAAIAVDKGKERSFLAKMFSCIVPGFPETFARIAFLTSIIQGLAQQEYPVTNVFITFETEKSQQEVLQTLTVSRHQVARQKATAVPHTRFLFRGRHLLSVKEPEEPDAIHWDHLNTSWADIFKQQLYTALATVAALLVVVFLVVVVNKESTILGAYTIALTNVLFPFSARALTKFEAHPTAASLQTSLYFKIALFRWVNTAIVITMITPFEDTLRNGDRGLISQIQAQFMAEITTVALIQIADPEGQLRRHFLAPRSKTQDHMNIQFQGTEVMLAERYTSISKIIFLTLWYCSIYPASLFVCAFALQVINWMDRFSLMRTWKRSPRLGSRISRFNRAYFLPLSIVAMAVFSSYFWSGFPYDNLCLNEGSQAGDQFAGNYSIDVHKAGSSLIGLYYGYENETETNVVDTVNATIEAGAFTYRFCNQDLLGRGNVSGGYPFVPLFQPDGDEWMTEEQIVVCTYYGWLSFFFAFGWLVIIFFRGLRNGIFGYFIASWKPTGEDQNMNYSDLDTVNLYVPEVHSPVISYPLLAVAVDKIDPVFMEWFDPEHPHAYYDLTKDAEVLVRHRGRPMVHNQVFSTVHHFPPSEEPEDTEGSCLTASGITEEYSGQKMPFSIARSA